jgi:hypothetical protein
MAMPPNRQHATMEIGWPLDSRTMAYLVSLKSVIAGFRRQVTRLRD